MKMATSDCDSDAQVPSVKYGYGKVQDQCERLTRSKQEELQNKARAFRKIFKESRSDFFFPLIYSEAEAQECAETFINEHGDLFEDPLVDRQRLINRVARLMCTQEAFQQRNDVQNGSNGKKRKEGNADVEESGNDSDASQFRPKRTRTESHNISRRRNMRSPNRGSGGRPQGDSARPRGPTIESPTPSPSPPPAPRLKLILENERRRLDFEDPLSAEVFKATTLQQFFDVFCRRSGRAFGPAPTLTFTPSWPDDPFEVASTDTDAAWEAVKEDVGNKFVVASRTLKDHKFRLRVKRHLRELYL
ncbi:uncharacterized protein PAC_08419 [Phialocephala subalpina]|uniref:Uncharacterized protein n=1 Tax=Phialocephala subalpina TaxID=576137 RepID=A0A1L7X0I5_9HELO|nr:uncharacterized protein PAC_08419 [Phialocephala subalpina]